MPQARSESVRTEQETQNTKGFLKVLGLVVLIGGPVTAGLWCHFTSLEHGVTKLEVLQSTLEILFNK